MKKKIIFPVLTALLSASSIAMAGGPEVLPPLDYFSGFYIGGIVGLQHFTIEETSNVVLTEPIALFNIIPLTLVQAGELNSFNASGGNYVGYGGVQGGVGKVFWQHFYLGVQGWGAWGSDTENNTQTTDIPFATRTVSIPAINIPPIVSFGGGNFNIMKEASATTSTSTEVSNNYGVAAKLGWVVAPRSMFYGKVGASWAEVNLSNSLTVHANTSAVNTDSGLTVLNADTTFNASSSTDTTKLGLLLGIGFEQFVWEDIVSINVEYNFVTYGHVTTPAAQLTGNTFVTVPTISNNTFGPFVTDTDVYTSATCDNIKISQLMAGINFYFAREWI